MIYPMIFHFLYNIVPGHNIHNFPCCLDPVARPCQLAGVGSLPCGFKPKWCLGQRQNLLQIWRNDGKKHGKWWLNWLNWLNSMDWFAWENLNTGNHQFPMKIMGFSCYVSLENQSIDLRQRPKLILRESNLTDVWCFGWYFNVKPKFC